jgi:hypothetical protein
LGLRVRRPDVTHDDHGIDVDEDTDLETADDGTAEAVPDDAEPPDGHVDDRYDERAEEARDQETPDAHRDEDPFQS